MMVLWWIGNVVLLLVVVPVLVALLNRVLAALERIRGASDDILGRRGRADRRARPGARAAGPRPTRPSTRSPVGAVRYAGSVAKLLGRRGRNDMPVAAWVTIVLIGLIIAAAALGLVRVILHLMAVRTHARHAARRGAGGRRQDQHRARGRCRRSTRTSSPSATSANRSERLHVLAHRTPPAGRSATRSASSSCSSSSRSSCRSSFSPISSASRRRRSTRACTESVHNTAALAGLQTTIESAEAITAGLRRGRIRLGG